MFEDVKTALDEVIEIANSCPDKYQSLCFEILLKQALKAGEPIEINSLTTPPLPPKSHDFFAQYSIAAEQHQRVFHSDGNTYTIIVRDLKTKTTSQKQIRLALLLGVVGLLERNEPAISRENLVGACEQYAAYDSANFAVHMRRNKNLFLPRSEGWILTVPGKDRAAEIVRELAE